MGDKGGFDYLDSVSADAGKRPTQSANLTVQQEGLEDAPVEGGEGYVGGNSNASTVGLDVVSGKKGSVTNRPIWSEQSSGDNQDQAAPVISVPGTDSTDEKATYKRIQTDEGLPQTYRKAGGADDAGPEGSDEPDARMGTDLNVQSHPSPNSGDASFPDMPQTEFTSGGGGGAPIFKHKG